ncbi:MAG TPA: hypothetical protein PK280_05005 [Planctomycetota bacterium]|nr:hypothetical protein [Planctomycetota bacterium]
MPEEKADKTAQAESESQPKPAAGRKVSPVAVIGVVAVLGLAVFAVVMLMGRKGPEPQAVKTPPPVNLPELLDIPPLEVSEIQVTVPTESSAIQRRSLAVGVVIYFAPAEGHQGGVKEVIAKLGPRLTNLSPKFRNVVITQLNTKSYGELIKSDVQDTLLSVFKDKFTEEMAKYGLDKVAKVDQVVWQEYSWGN